MQLTSEPTTAHGKLAAAVDVHLKAMEGDDLQAWAASADKLQLALGQYRIAELAAVSAPVDKIIDRAIESLQGRRIDDALTCLRTMKVVSSFTPLVDVGKVTAPASKPSGAAQRMAAFEPTHTHADGGRYQLVEHGPGKFSGVEATNWTPGVIYRGEDGILRWTAETRWNARFRVIGDPDHTGAHMTHCNQGEYEGSCKYGDPDTCPALREA